MRNTQKPPNSSLDWIFFTMEASDSDLELRAQVTFQGVMKLLGQELHLMPQNLADQALDAVYFRQRKKISVSFWVSF